MADYIVTIRDDKFDIPSTPVSTDRTIKLVNATGADVVVTLHGLLKLETFSVPRDGSLSIGEVKAGDSTHTITAPASDPTAPIKGTIKVGTGLPG
ncbi:MAG: hypothetical protein QM820_61965 [Minicystis sp.]